MLRLLLAASALATATAVCPNACSGHGTCGMYDMCTCYSNWQGNDCSERTCPTAHAFVTTPQGDLNMDGDRYDNSQKLLVKQTGGSANTGTMLENDDILTLNNAIVSGELIVGDAIRISDETFVITSVVASTKFQMDHDRFTSIVPADNVYKYIETVSAPKGSWESWAGDYSRGVDEGHFYMECANRGVCDRKEGVCECFDGYTGSACQRQACPNDCNGHGTCETVNELASSEATKITGFTAYSGTTAFEVVVNGNGAVTKANSNTLMASSDPTGSLSAGDTIRLGSPSGENHVISKVTTTTIHLTSVTTAEHPFGTAVYLVPKYSLWDGNQNRACKCDAAYTGDDCSSRKCPIGDDPLTTENVYTDASSSDQVMNGNTDHAQGDEAQSIYLETARGSLSGSFTLTFTDAFGQRWTTGEIDINERLSSKVWVGATTTTVTFSPPLPYGELEAGDYLMIGDERAEVATVYPEVSTTVHRPIKLGGVVDSVVVHNGYTVSSKNVYGFRAGPAKGIKAALLALPNGVIPSVETSNFQTGTLLGYPAEGVAAASASSFLTLLKNINGKYDQQQITGCSGTATDGSLTCENDPATDGSAVCPAGCDVWTGEANTGPTTGPAMSYNGGLAPYDTIRVVATDGRSEFLQVRNVDVWVDGKMEMIAAKGKASATGTVGYGTATTSATPGIDAGKGGAVFRSGGYHVRVKFTGNAGNLPELEVDESGLYAVFVREFTGTVTSASPSKVSCHLHGGSQYDATVAYPFPHYAGDGVASAVSADDQNGQGRTVMYKGDVADLKVMAGMKVKLGNQVRTVVTDIASASSSAVASFYVDRPFVPSDAAESVDNVDYLFYHYPVEQIYDEATYNALTMSRAIFMPSEAAQTTKLVAGNLAAAATFQTAGTAVYLEFVKVPASAATGWSFTGIDGSADDYGVGSSAANSAGQAVLFPAGSTMTCSGSGLCTTGAACADRDLTIIGASTMHASTADGTVGTRLYVHVMGNSDTQTAASTARQSIKDYLGGYSSGGWTGVMSDQTSAPGTQSDEMVCRFYDSMSTLSTGTAAFGKSPPLHENYRTISTSVTDQRPLTWAAPDPDNARLTRVLGSPSGVALRGIVGAGGAALQIDVVASGGITLTLGSSGTVLTIANGPSFLDYFGFDAFTDLTSQTQALKLTISGCSANSNFNMEHSVSALTATALTFGTISAPDAADGVKCVGDTVTMQTRLATLTDSKAIAIGDRLKVLQTGRNADAVEATCSLASPTVCTVANGMSHGFNTHDRVKTGTLTGTGTGLSANTEYFVVRILTGGEGNSLTFNLKAVSDGAPGSSSVNVASGTVTTTFSPGTISYETRTVDKIWASGTTGQVTEFSVKDPYSNVRNLQNVEAWVDESGTKEELECGRRGLCGGEEGICECFAGYTGQACGSINSLYQ